MLDNCTVVARWQEEGDESANDDDAAAADANAVQNERYIQEDVERVDRIGQLGWPLDICEVLVESA